MTHRTLSCGCLLLLVSLGTGCRKKGAAPPPVAPVVVLPKIEKPPPKPPPTLPPAPTVEPPKPGEPPVNVEVKPLPKPEPPKRRRVRAATKKKTEPSRQTAEVKPVDKPAESKPATPEPGTPASTPPAPEAPKIGLGQMLSAEQQREYTRRFDGATDRTRQALVVIQSKLLTEEQKETVGRIRTFLTQAEQAKEPDLLSAVNLAERADMLSKDLLDRLR